MTKVLILGNAVQFTLTSNLELIVQYLVAMQAYIKLCSTHLLNYLPKEKRYVFITDVSAIEYLRNRFVDLLVC